MLQTLNILPRECIVPNGNGEVAFYVIRPHSIVRGKGRFVSFIWCGFVNSCLTVSCPGRENAARTQVTCKSAVECNALDVVTVTVLKHGAMLSNDRSVTLQVSFKFQLNDDGFNILEDHWSPRVVDCETQYVSCGIKDTVIECFPLHRDGKKLLSSHLACYSRQLCPRVDNERRRCLR